ncbi:MAG: hypothetical protein J4F45_00570 [Pseudomonadales bacterium]|nr:hypothetical protein [Pseudomonadales bacterium]
MNPRRGLEEIGLSFLDVICCGFGAIILLLMIVKTVEPILLEEPVINLEGLVIEKRDSLNEIIGRTRILTRQLSDEERQLARDLAELARLERDLNDILARYHATAEEAEHQNTERLRLARAKQSLTEEMERLLGLDFVRSTRSTASTSSSSSTPRAPCSGGRGR